MFRMLMFLTAVSCALAGPAAAEPYWIAYEGNDFPENDGWERSIGNGGANRWIEDGALVIDSMHNAGISDAYIFDGIGDPGLGEMFVAEWRVLSEDMLYWYDAGVTIARDATPGNVKINLGVDEILVRPDWEVIPIVPYDWHIYRIESQNMAEYTLAIDGQHVFTGQFEDQTFLQSYIAWGDRGIGAASRTRWDYVRFGVVPEPSAGVAFSAIVPVVIRRRSTT